MKDILVTGAPGWLCDVLLPEIGKSAAGGNVRCLVQRSLPGEKIAAWQKEHPEVSHVLSGDLADVPSLEAACKDLSGGTVLHAAGVIHPRNTSEWYRINRDGTLALANAAKKVGAKRFVYVSSNAAQGASSSSSVLLTEDMPDNPGSHYGRSKLQAERGLMQLHEAGKFDVVVLRPCMFYGPPVPGRHVDIFKRIMNGRLPLVGSGDYARSLSYIDDLVAGTMLGMTHPKAAGEVFNICDARAYSTREVCDAMAAALGVPAKFIPLPGICATLARGVDVTLAACGVYSMPFHLLGEANWNVGCSSQKATDLLGFKPSVDVFEGYRRAVSWCRERKLV
ncbi:MAG TPA: NAD-dependent epimerase/dehydratase family protein [Planctomycetota bacterium]|jgi:nucleoside-diphosphate-sugar epimerase